MLSKEKPRAELLKNMKTPVASAAESEADADLESLLGDAGEYGDAGDESGMGENADAEAVASPLGDFSDEDLLAELHARGLVDMGEAAAEEETPMPAAPKKK